MQRLLRLLGSIKIAVPLLVTIAVVLAWGTIYESLYGTAAVQRFIYHSWAFQALLAFLAANLAIAAYARYPWKRKHVPFVLAHIGIILILTGGIIGARWGIEGQLIIPEGQAQKTLETPGNVLVIHDAKQGLHQVVPTRFETQAWVHEPDLAVPVRLGQRLIELRVERYFPDAMVEEQVAPEGADEWPAVQLVLGSDEQQQAVWLFARDPHRFGAGFGDLHLLFLEPESEAQRKQLLGLEKSSLPVRGSVSVLFPGRAKAYTIVVPDPIDQNVPIEGTPYRITFKEYFPDFALSPQGPVNRSQEPNNPAVALTLQGPEGVDAHLLFALHPDFAMLHGRSQKIKAEVRYAHAASSLLPPNAVVLVRQPQDRLSAVLTDGEGSRQLIDPVSVGQLYTHAASSQLFTVAAYYPQAKIEQKITNRGNDVRQEYLYISAREEDKVASGWLPLRQSIELALGSDPITVEFGPGQRELPVTVKLLDFRKIDYPGTDMAAGFESDVELTDLKRGIILMRKIHMNHPLRYQGYSFFQSSFIAGQTETTVLSVRNDPGTPVVYAGFIIVILGVVSLFLLRSERFRNARWLGTSTRGKGRRL